MIVHDISEYIHWNLPDPQFYIKDILPKQGVMLVYGEPKIKKSWLAMYIAFCISTGSEFLGMRTEQARTMLCNFEISPIAYGKRLKDMAVHFTLQEMMLYETSPMLMYLDDQQNFNTFHAMIREIQPKVIILDCMAACYGGDENDGEAMARWIEKINVLKAESESSVIIVHHTNKNLLSNSSTDRARGHSRLTGYVDTLCYIAPQPMGVQLQFKARQATRDVLPLNVKFENYIWSLR